MHVYWKSEGTHSQREQSTIEMLCQIQFQKQTRETLSNPNLTITGKIKQNKFNPDYV